MQTQILIGPDRPSLATQMGVFALAMLGTGVATLAGQLMATRWGTGPVVLLYILPVLGAAIYAGLWQSVAAAVVATLAYNYFFTAPLHTLIISSPADVVTVTVLFVVAVVTSSLAASLRKQSRLAAARASGNATIAGFAGRLLSCADRDAIFAVAASELSRLFSCHTAIVEGGPPRIVAAAPGQANFSPADLAAAAHAMATGEPAGRGARRGANIADWQFHSLREGERRVAAIGLAREDGAPPIPGEQGALFGSLLDQASLALARAHAEEEARSLATLRERDGLRDALLSSIGQDVKPSLNAIGAGVRKLRRSGAVDKEAVSSVAAETVKLERYIDNLVDLAPGSDREPITAGEVVIDLYRRTVTRCGETVRLTPKEYAVLAELAKHAGRVLTHAQLLRSVWGPARQDQLDYLRVAVGALRRKLEDNPAEPKLIVNEPAVGYRLAAS